MVFAWLTAACQVSPSVQVASAPPTAAEVAQLTRRIQALSPHVSAAEARRAAEIALAVAESARQEHRPVTPAGLNNVLINSGMKSWGLCWHWTERLGRALRQVSFSTLSVRWVCAHPKSVWREHNAVLLTPRWEQDFEWSRGLILDPWRKSGRLAWVIAQEDAYPWQLDPAAEWRWLPE